MTVALRIAIDDDLAAAADVASRSLDLDPEDSADLPALLWADQRGAERLRVIAEDDGEPVGLLLGSLQGDDAHLDLLAVVPEARRRGVGRALVDAWEAAARASGARRLRAGADLLGYVWPGVDVRYTAALSLLVRRGFTRTDVVWNMDVALAPEIAPSPEQLRRVEDAGIVVRRCLPGDVPALDAYTAAAWTPSWHRETLLAAARYPAPLFLAFRGDDVVGFAAHGVFRPNLYGPIATDPTARGIGLGDVLSRLCLADMAADGVRTAQIGWVAEDAIPFYSRTVGARLGRCFWMLERPLT
ncbi:GNAT family N-acetyltransferase [Amnibacterium sp. CER49]|uniref:GNAT family N-acetyltransferase n=1 Tax=Amnibacterium sp. CER49 TaxID=3039161 RepID=UPI00244AAD11|nr:GNAT family N-acetyltransferase [Amnibacterium sp. CER49]MDH2442966.1 GNAT family N-acetyltransferase [Amnibacterium sp. CER49]